MKLDINYLDEIVLKFRNADKTFLTAKNFLEHSECGSPEEEKLLFHVYYLIDKNILAMSDGMALNNSSGVLQLSAPFRLTSEGFHSAFGQSEMPLSS